MSFCAQKVKGDNQFVFLPYQLCDKHKPLTSRHVHWIFSVYIKTMHQELYYGLKECTFGVIILGAMSVDSSWRLPPRLPDAPGQTVLGLSSSIKTEFNSPYKGMLNRSLCHDFMNFRVTTTLPRNNDSKYSKHYLQQFLEVQQILWVLRFPFKRNIVVK